MRLAFTRAAAAATLCAAFTASPSLAAGPAKVNADGSMDIAGYRVRCADVRTRLDRRLNNLGAAAPDERLLLINPVMLAAETPVVQLFVYHHECGHHRIGASEIGADCWAVERGVEDGWLDRAGIKAVCDSFGGAPATATHPSAKKRCGALDQCFAKALAKRQTPMPGPVEAAKGSIATATVATYRPVKAEPQPQLVQGPRLVRDGRVR